ncbi:MAG: hypothetical protein ABSD49_14135, partial [Candidatus Bathyarchaeia archaeon]
MGEAAFLAISGVTLIACSRLLPAQGGRELLAIATIETVMTAEQIEFKIREMLKSDFFSIEKVNVVQEDEQPPLILRPLSSHYQTSDVKFTCSLL